MLTLSAVLLSFLPLQSAAELPAAAPRDVYQQVEVTLESPQSLRSLSAIGVEIVSVSRDRTVAKVIARTDDLVALDQSDLPYTVQIDDLQTWYADRLAADPGPTVEASTLGQWLSPPWGQGSIGGYYSFTELVSVIDQIQAAYPSIVTAKQSIGTSVEGRNLWAFTISDNPGVSEGEPQARLDSLHHAREPMGLHALLWYVLFLVENYGTDPLADYLVDERETWFIPCVNPDGYIYNESIAPNGGGMWRKNRKNNGDGTTGVDLNRNYDYQWGYDNLGSSPSSSNDLYRGPSAASEPETQAMQAFIQSKAFGTTLSIHCFSDLWLRPYGYDFVDPANLDDYIELGDLCVEVNNYANIAGVILYPANGTTDDYDHEIGGSMAFTPEIGGNEDGFWPPTSNMIGLAEENLQAFQRTVLAAGAYLRAGDVTMTENGDGDGFFEAGESVDIVVTARNSGVLASATSVIGKITTSSLDAVASATTFDFGTVGGFSENDNVAAPFSLSINPGTAPGTAIPFEVELDYEGTTVVIPLEVIAGRRFLFAFDEVELDLGWTPGDPSDTATTGIWEQGDPVGTTSGGELSNPEEDATRSSGQFCFVTGNGGGSAGNDDVDGGATTLYSPPFDLSGAGIAYIGYARWFANLTSPDDSLVVELSNDGGTSWSTLETVTATDDVWVRVEHRVNDYMTPTDDMLLRFTASDTGTPSLVEAGVDDVFAAMYETEPRISFYGTAELGTPIHLHVTGEENDIYVHFFSTGTGVVSIPDVTNDFLLDPFNFYDVFAGFMPASGFHQQHIDVLDEPYLSGLTLYWQTIMLSVTESFMTNRLEMHLF